MFLIAGLILIAIDIFLAGLSPLMFIAAGALLTSAVLYFGWLETDLLGALLLCVVLSVLSASLGWYPLNRLQKAMGSGPVGSDLVGRELDTTAEVGKRSGTIRWSGTEWQARLAPGCERDSLPPGRRVTITAVEGVTLILSPID